MTDHLASLSETMDMPTFATIATLREEAKKELGKRGIDPLFAEQLGWRSSERSLNSEVTIEIPYYLNGIEINYKTRTLTGEKQFSQKKDGVKCLYNVDCLTEWLSSGHDLLMTEGEMDCIIALQHGFFAVSVPDGAPSATCTASEVKYSYLDGFPRNGAIILCTDSDGPGKVLEGDLSELLGNHRVKTVKYPKGCKDLNETFECYGEKGIYETIRRAKWADTSGVAKMSEIPEPPAQESKPLGFIPINLRKGDFCVITGVPSSGKSTIINHMAHVMATQGWVTAFASFEQATRTHHRHALRKLAVNYADYDEFIDAHYRFIRPADDIRLVWLLNTMAKAAIQHKVDMFVIDPWNELDHAFDRKEMNLTDYTGFAIKKLKEFAQRYNVHVMVAAHPSKMQRIKAGGEYPIPSLYDIADSAHWYNKPDLGIVIHINDDGSTKVRIAKSRYHQEIGKPGDYTVTFDPETHKYTNHDEPNYSYALL